MKILCLVLIGISVGDLVSAQRISALICYTQWFDRDNPSGNGDYETLSDLRAENPGKICSNPLTIQAATLSGVPAQAINQVIQWNNTVSGFACVNDQQNNQECCLDYKVRFGCPCTFSSFAEAKLDDIEISGK